LAVAYMVLSIPFLAYAAVVLFDVGCWSSIKGTISTPWRLVLGLLWLATGCGLIVTAALHKVVFYVWTPAVIGAVLFFYFLSKVGREPGPR
jgi:hypothetical protein